MVASQETLSCLSQCAQYFHTSIMYKLYLAYGRELFVLYLTLGPLYNGLVESKYSRQNVHGKCSRQNVHGKMFTANFWISRSQNSGFPGPLLTQKWQIKLKKISKTSQIPNILNVGVGVEMLALKIVDT